MELHRLIRENSKNESEYKHAHPHLVKHAVRFECRRASAHDTSSFGVPQLGIDGQFATELRLAAVHRDASHDGNRPVFFHYLTFEVVNN